jgi:type IV pilus assembly protein PilF
MKRLRQVAWCTSVFCSTLLLGCASNPAATPERELSTASDQTASQHRSSIRLQLAVGYYRQGQMKVALDEAKRAIEADPNSADAYNMAALIYMQLGDPSLAESHFQRAIQRAPNDPDLRNNYGWFLCQNGRAKESIPYFEAAIHDKSYQSPAKALNNAGKCTDDKAASERYYMQAFHYEPANVETNIALARINYERGANDRARFYINRVATADVLSAEVLLLAIKIERKAGDRGAELSFVTQLARRYPDSAEYAAYQRGALND